MNAKVMENNVITTVREDIRAATGWSIALSVLMMISGVLAIAIPPVAGIAVTAMIGSLLVVSGALHVGFAARGDSAAAVFGELAMAMLYGALGLYLLARPVAGLASLTLLIAACLALKGVFEAVVAFTIRLMPGSGWLLFDAVLTLALAVMIGGAWPASTAWAVGTLVGVSMLSGGFARLMTATAVRRLVS